MSRLSDRTDALDDGRTDPLRPDDHVDHVADGPGRDDGIVQPSLGFVGWLRYLWRQLTSMRTALFLLLLLAIAAVPGSLVPQRSADPNGVHNYESTHPVLYPILNSLQVFDTYTSAWFSSIYLLLFISLVGCVIPRIRHHIDALRAAPPRTPARLSRFSSFHSRLVEGVSASTAIDSARAALRSSGYRTVVHDGPRGEKSVSAERGYLRETGNLVFHVALLGILVTVGIGGGFGWTAQRLVVQGDTSVNSQVSFDSISPGRFFSPTSLDPYSIRLDRLDVAYQTKGGPAQGQPLDYTAHVTTTEHGRRDNTTIKVNTPLAIGGTDVYLLGNGYAPTITVRDPAGRTVFRESVPFLPQNANLTSTGVVKVTDGLAEQLGMVGYFAPTAGTSAQGAITSNGPALKNPRLELQVFEGDLGVNKGVPSSVYELNTDTLKQLNGRGTDVPGTDLVPGQTKALPDGLGTITFDGVKRYASLDIHHDPTKGAMLVFAMLILAGLLTSLFIPRRRLWVKAVPRDDGMLELEYAGLARGEDPGIAPAVRSLVDRHHTVLAAENAESAPSGRT